MKRHFVRMKANDRDCKREVLAMFGALHSVAAQMTKDVEEQMDIVNCGEMRNTTKQHCHKTDCELKRTLPQL